jgi:hypothetical protein
MTIRDVNLAAINAILTRNAIKSHPAFPPVTAESEVMVSHHVEPLLDGRPTWSYSAFQSFPNLTTGQLIGFRIRSTLWAVT